MTCSRILLIEHWKNKAKKSNRGIAKLLSKTPYIINNEIKRDLIDLSFNGEFVEYSKIQILLPQLKRKSS